MKKLLSILCAAALTLSLAASRQPLTRTAAGRPSGASRAQSWRSASR